MNKKIFYFGAILLAIFSYLFDYLRRIVSMTYDMLLGRLLDILFPIIFISVILFLTFLAFRLVIQPIVAVLLLLAGLILVGFPFMNFLDNPNYISFSERFGILLAPTSFYIHTAGAYLSSMSVISIIRYFRTNKEIRTRK